MLTWKLILMTLSQSISPSSALDWAKVINRSHPGHRPQLNFRRPPLLVIIDQYPWNSKTFFEDFNRDILIRSLVGFDCQG